MIYTHHTLQARVYARAGLLPNSSPTHTLDSLAKTEWSPQFEQLMRNRLIMGALRYGKLHAPGKPKYNRITSMVKRLTKYIGSGNKELLVDVANLCLLEFEECHHPLAHFHSVDDGEHVTTKG